MGVGLMRDVGRLDSFYDELKTIHKKCFPDWRFGQLCWNFYCWLVEEYKVDPFFPEEERMLVYIREYARVHSMFYRPPKDGDK